jgi:hypothetical protein
VESSRLDILNSRSELELRNVSGSLWALYGDDLFHVERARVHIHHAPYDCGVELTADGLDVEICASCELSDLIRCYADETDKNGILVLNLGEELSSTVLSV